MWRLLLITAVAADKVALPSQSCAHPSNYHMEGCFLYRACEAQESDPCLLYGYMVLPKRPTAGLESIGNDPGAFDVLARKARSLCGSCILLVNPPGYRTQHQLHLHYRHPRPEGLELTRRLERAVCASPGWRPFSICEGGEAVRLSSLSPFSKAAERDLGGAGISVYPSVCGELLLLSRHCTLEHRVI
jgi:hypothetical protein